MTDTPEPALPAAAPPAGRPLAGVALVLLAVLAFALCDVIVKALARDHPVTLIQAARYGVNLALLLALLGPRHGGGLWRTQRTAAVMARGLVLALASLTMSLALRLMPLGETVAIIYLAPFVVMVLAGPVLGERVGPAGWAAAALGFAGVLLIMRPGTGLDPAGVLWALANVGLGAAYHLMTRVLTRTETTQAMLFHVALVGTVFFGTAALPALRGPLPAAPDLALMLALGALATLGHFLFTAAYREAPAALLAPVNFMHLVWAGGLGWLVFGHAPDGLTILGMALVCAAGGFIAMRAHFAR
ncbi:MAG: DMT family transporter [Rhodobacteraceae bacterium]|nr:DMT family transporter [Paracoccaceae bacterium]